MSDQCSAFIVIPDENQKDLKICHCCLKENVPFINLLSCCHSNVFYQLFQQSSLQSKLVCQPCHRLLVKTTTFKNQVECSTDWLNKVNYRDVKKHDKFKPILTLETTPVQINSISNRAQKKSNNKKLKKTSNDPINHHDDIWHAEQPLVENWQELTYAEDGDNEEGQNSLDPPIKMEVDSSDEEENLPLSHVNDPVDSENEDNTHASNSKRKTTDIYAGKVAAVCISEKEYLLEKEQERLKESYLKLPFRCVACAVGFDHEEFLNEHNEKRHVKKRGSIVCELCRSVLNTSYSYQEHYRRHLKRYECCVCGKRYITCHASVEHYREQHGDIVTAFTCEQCGFTTDSNRRYRYHREKHKAKPQCSACGKLFVNRSGLKIHVLTQHKNPKNTYTCPSKGCNKRFKTKTGFRAHVNNVHQSNSVYCDTCRTHFKSPSTLKHHLLTHSAHLSKDDWKFACDECGKKFLLKLSLRQHIDWAHLGKNTHQCELCSKVYKTKRYLRRHRDFVHDKKRPPKDKICDHCGKGFTTLSMLRTHIRTHTGERPLSCARCPATFAHPSALYTHNKLLHNKD